VGKVLFVVLLGAAVAGAGFTGYHAVRYDLLQPFPLAWNHLPEEVELLELEYLRRGLVAKLGSAERISSLSGLHMPLAPGSPGEELKAELAALDARIGTLRARVRAIKERTGAGGSGRSTTWSDGWRRSSRRPC